LGRHDIGPSFNTLPTNTLGRGKKKGEGKGRRMYAGRLDPDVKPALASPRAWREKERKRERGGEENGSSRPNAGAHFLLSLTFHSRSKRKNRRGKGGEGEKSRFVSPSGI